MSVGWKKRKMRKGKKREREREREGIEKSKGGTAVLVIGDVNGRLNKIQ